LTTRRYLIALALAWATLLYCVPAHATTTEDAIAIACGPGHAELAPIIDAAARRQLEHPVTLVALMAVESHCRADAVSRKGAVGLLQVLPYGPAANGHTLAELRDPAVNIATGARWLGLMTLWAGGLPGGLGCYNTGKRGHGARFAKHVLTVANRICRELARRHEPRS